MLSWLQMLGLSGAVCKLWPSDVLVIARRYRYSYFSLLTYRQRLYLVSKPWIATLAASYMCSVCVWIMSFPVDFVILIKYLCIIIYGCL